MIAMESSMSQNERHKESANCHTEPHTPTTTRTLSRTEISRSPNKRNIRSCFTHSHNAPRRDQSSHRRSHYRRTSRRSCHRNEPMRPNHLPLVGRIQYWPSTSNSERLILLRVLPPRSYIQWHRPQDDRRRRWNLQTERQPNDLRLQSRRGPSLVRHV